MIGFSFRLFHLPLGACDLSFSFFSDIWLLEKGHV